MAKIDPDETQTMFRPVHKDRRALPRVTLSCPGKVILPSGDVVNVMIYDLSRDGLQIRCGKKAAHAINPDGKAIKKGASLPEIQVLFYVPLDSGKVVKIANTDIRHRVELPRIPGQVPVPRSPRAP